MFHYVYLHWLGVWEIIYTYFWQETEQKIKQKKKLKSGKKQNKLVTIHCISFLWNHEKYLLSVSTNHLIKSNCDFWNTSKFLVLAGTEDFYLLGHRSSCVIFSWEEVSRVAGLSLTMVRRTIGQGRSMLPDELCRTTIFFINWCPLSKKAWYWLKLMTTTCF